jgi:hypothetical protein
VPALTVCAVRMALSYLGVGFTIGALMLGARGLSTSSHPAPAVRPGPRERAAGLGFAPAPEPGGVERRDGGRTRSTPGVIIAGHFAELLAGLAFAGHAWQRARLYSR